MDDKILFYEGEFYMYSNFASFMVDVFGSKRMTSEHAYQAMKFLDHEPAIAEEVKNAPSAHECKKIAKNYEEKKRKDRSEVKLEIMETIVRAKHAQHPYIQKKLLESGNREIIEDSPKDAFRGRGPDWKGENHLGKIWMKIREEK